MRSKDVDRALRILDELEFHNPKVYVKVGFLRMLFEEERESNSRRGVIKMSSEHEGKLRAGHKKYLKGLRDGVLE